MRALLWTALSIVCLSALAESKQAASRRRARSTDEYEVNKKCSYTFLIPQQKVTGPICANSKGPTLEKDRVTKMDLENVKDVLTKQKREMETLQLVVDVDGNIVNEMKLLRKESRNMNSRVTQLYMQLLHEIIRKRDNSLEISQLETRILNVTSEMFRMGSRYKELEAHYSMLAALVNNQSIMISMLEEQCMRTFNKKDLPVMPPLVQVVPPNIPHNNRYTSILYGGNEIQRDQNPAYPQEQEMVLNKSPTGSPIGIPPVLITVNTDGPFKDCYHVRNAGYAASGIYLVKPENSNSVMQVWCEHGLDNGGWTVIQRRMDGSVNFFRNWENYKKGFGDIDKEYWLGLENIYSLTKQGSYRLLIELEDWTDKKVYAEYSSFHVEPETDYYRLRLGTYQGNAGDSLMWHNGKQFTTLDRDKDAYSGNCAHFHKGGWWYNSCAQSNLNGVWYRGGQYRSKFQDGIYWAEYRGGSYSLRRVQMLLRPID
ncbi:angiopoietin-related protein 1a [Polypterus senegalus]|uniref:angiopoietin-related protein 1a n=1 Tax=Polypterus senegalus TaxID=55291 RepID=UPI001965234F|nr:angiopoietin-related protein 1a [Polypterus senegalus]XP_039590448.1 angiopoietin-related protein 1a [Polypterus senegalus]